MLLRCLARKQQAKEADDIEKEAQATSNVAEILLRRFQIWTLLDLTRTAEERTYLFIFFGSFAIEKPTDPASGVQSECDANVVGQG